MFQGWDSAFQIIGTAGATLIGLLFVVVSLAERGERSRLLRAVSIYLTPTAIHFAVALSVSVVVVAPRLPPMAKGALVVVAALVGLGNAIWACIGMLASRPGAAPPHWSDFWLYGATPAALYVGLALAAGAIWEGVGGAAEATAAALLALLLLGVRNAWDLVTWMAPNSTGTGRAPEA